MKTYIWYEDDAYTHCIFYSLSLSQKKIMIRYFINIIEIKTLTLTVPLTSKAAPAPLPSSLKGWMNSLFSVGSISVYSSSVCLCVLAHDELSLERVEQLVEVYCFSNINFLHHWASPTPSFHLHELKLTQMLFRLQCYIREQSMQI